MPQTETTSERVNRELIELLNELRVALPGAQVLFGFLLAVPFQQRFRQTTAFQQDVYFATLSCALVATALLIAPSAYHRLNFRRHDKQAIVLIANRLLIIGMGVLALAMVGVVVLIGDLVFGAIPALIGALAAGMLFLVLWAVLPLRERHRQDDALRN